MSCPVLGGERELAAHPDWRLLPRWPQLPLCFCGRACDSGGEDPAQRPGLPLGASA